MRIESDFEIPSLKANLPLAAVAPIPFIIIRPSATSRLLANNDVENEHIATIMANMNPIVFLYDIILHITLYCYWPNTTFGNLT